jgi:predicted nucleic acid-binding Zn finger protein
MCPNMTLSIFVKGKVDFRCVEIWLWVFLSKEKLTLEMSKYDIEYVCQNKNWFQICSNMTLSMFVKGKYNIEYVCQKKSWFQTYPNMILSIFIKKKYDFEYVW